LETCALRWLWDTVGHRWLVGRGGYGRNSGEDLNVCVSLSIIYIIVCIYIYVCM
jgi:hypothetical protein